MKRGFTLIELLVVIAIIAILAAILFPVFARARESARLRVCTSNAAQMAKAIEIYMGDADDKYPMNRFPDRTHKPSNNWGALHGSCYDWKRAIMIYVKSKEVQICPANEWAWRPSEKWWSDYPGIESNHCYGKATDPPESRPEWFPKSYAYNGRWFHESSALSEGKASQQRARKRSELQTPASVIYILETRGTPPDIGDWCIPRGACACQYCNEGGDPSKNDYYGLFFNHRGIHNWIFADTHAKAMKLSRTIYPNQMWTDSRYVDGIDAQKRLEQEYADPWKELLQ